MWFRLNRARCSGTVHYRWDMIEKLYRVGDVRRAENGCSYFYIFPFPSYIPYVTTPFSEFVSSLAGT